MIRNIIYLGIMSYYLYSGHAVFETLLYLLSGFQMGLTIILIKNFESMVCLPLSKANWFGIMLSLTIAGVWCYCGEWFFAFSSLVLMASVFFPNIINIFNKEKYGNI